MYSPDSNPRGILFDQTVLEPIVASLSTANSHCSKSANGIGSPFVSNSCGKLSGFAPDLGGVRVEAIETIVCPSCLPSNLNA